MLCMFIMERDRFNGQVQIEELFVYFDTIEISRTLKIFFVKMHLLSVKGCIDCCIIFREWSKINYGIYILSAIAGNG